MTRLNPRTLTEQGEAYCAGWAACFQGQDGRYTNPHDHKTRHDLFDAWSHGFLDAMEAEDGEEPEPEWAGYGA